MERGLEEASVRRKNECQVKLVDTEKLGLGVILNQDGFYFHHNQVFRSSSNISLFEKYHQGSADRVKFQPEVCIISLSSSDTFQCNTQ